MKRLRNVLTGFSSTILLVSCNNNKSDFDASGVFEATEVIVSSESSGKIHDFSVQEGQEIKAGEMVGFIDTVQLYLRKMQLIANVKAIQSRRPDINTQIAAITEQISAAKVEKNRIESLLKANAANKKQLDDINAQIAVLNRQLEAQKSSLSITNKGISEESSALEIQIAQVEDLLQKCRIVNPINGTVLTKYAQQSEIAAPGKALYKIADTKNMILRAYVTSGQLTQLKLGQKVKVKADYGDKGYREYQGTISWISSKSEFTPKTIQTRDERANLVYAVKVAVPNDGYIKIGMYGGIEIEEK
ncbi:MAG: HlyD family efflux transporter periplasmic adaptor subunit [Fibrobacter sp.]|jgi:HlyD family secretion protein|nr:HlyD family efflux transporter periplasmic adaptor subunit [Fibrobacter sp.]